MADTTRQQRVLDEARSFADREIRPNASAFDESAQLPRALIAKLAERRYLGASLPEAYGGLGLDPVYYGLFTEEIGKACCSTRSLLTVHTSMVGETILKWGTQEQKDKWLPLIAAGEKIAAFALSEPDVGTDAKGVKTLYQKVSDGYLINGRKKWISFGEIADVFIIVASDSRQCTAFILERNLGVRSQPIHGMLGCRAAHVAELDLENIIIPPNCVLGQEGSGFPFIVGTALDHGRYSVAWAGVAIAQESLEAMLAYARKRKQFGQKIHDFQLVRGLIGDAVTGTHAARALALRAGELRKIGDPQAFAETTIAKYFSSKVAMKVAADAVQVHGGNGCCNAYPVERLFREAKILEIIEGTSQIQQDIIAKHAIRRGS